MSSIVFDGAARLRSGPHPERARQDAERLLLHVIAKNKAWLMAHADELLDNESESSYRKLVERRIHGEPIQYITGETEFFGLPFRVTRDVLIPRPETEHLVEKVLELVALLQDAGAEAQHSLVALSARLKSFPDTEPRLSSAFKAPRIVDIGTGSGAIAVALAHKLPHAQITAIDLSALALKIARKNAERNGVDLRFLEGDLLVPVAAEKFDFVVSNPPYVPESDRETLSVEVRDYEPGLALFAGDDGLEVYRRLIPAAYDALTPNGFLILEIGYRQSPAIAELLARTGFQQIEFVPDLQGIPRVACAQRQGNRRQA
jgi:release factor glutamine methyltransferase